MANSCTPEFWTLKEIRDSLEKEWHGKKKIVIPMFQRGKRWPKEKKETFIDSLRKRYPVGTLLFYKTFDGEQEIYTLIDGLQRGSAIKEYLSNPSKFFSINDLQENTRNNLYNLIISGGSFEKQKEKIDNIISSYINALKGYDDLSDFDIYDLLSSEFPIIHNKGRELKAILSNDFKALKDDYNQLCSMSIPAIVYTGDEDTLPEIFARINSKGVALTEYEIYAASWPRKEFQIDNENIIEYVLKKYDLLNDSEYSISKYNRDDKRRKKIVNAFEYVFGLSKYLQNTYQSLNFYYDKKADETNPVAFQLLNACFNSAHSQIKDVHKIVLRFCKNISKLEEALFSSIEFVNKCIDPILKFKGNNRKDATKKFHSQYQIMSLISFVFRKKYVIDHDVISINDNWKIYKQRLQKNIWKYYVYDILCKYWGEGGTGKIHTANNEDRYLIELSESQLSIAYDSHAENMYNRREIMQVKNPSDEDFVILNTVYVHNFSAMDQLSIDKFDVEHIATKAQMKKLILKAKGIGLPISHIANLCYLPEFDNRSKGSNNFYQDLNYLERNTNTLQTIEDKYSFTTSDDLEFMNLSYADTDFEELQRHYVNEFLKKRNKIIKEKFLKSLGFEPSSDNKNERFSKTIFDENFLRFTKIGLLIRELISYLATNDLITKDDLINLQDKEYSSSKMGCAYPVIVKDKEDTIDSNGKIRYYQEQVLINKEYYYLCSQWYEHDRNYIISWFMQKIK